MLLSSDTPIGISKSMGLAQISFAEAYSELNPDILVVLGDRFEIFSAASAAMVARIPIAHLHGGETTEGAFDEAIRHSITKMSHLHFVATEAYRQRVIQLGEDPAKVFNFGAPGLDNIDKLQMLDKDELQSSLGFKFGKKNLLVTFHPATLELSSAKEQFQQLLLALDDLKDTHVIFTKANADTDGRVINAMIDSYVIANPNKSIAFASLGQLRYLSALRHVDAVVGNSSSGLIEAPSFRIGTINIGDRQRGRIKADSVIDCAPNRVEIQGALSKLYLPEIQNHLREVKNPYGEGGASKKIAETLSNHPLTGLLKKKFVDSPKTKLNE
jgi:GDP/UDP-N,N'-diacetylbacillosamine 2-epimerase (hydrolysing)